MDYRDEWLKKLRQFDEAAKKEWPYLNSTAKLLGAIEKTFEKDKTLLSFGVKFLDKAMWGIAKNDLILIGAPTGSGKTELVTHIARINTERGKNVFFFALEAENREIEMRLLYKIAAQKFFDDASRPFGKFNYEMFYYGKVQPLAQKYFIEASREFHDKYKTLRTIYREGGDFSIKHLEEHLKAIRSNADLIIIDHLNYFDTEGRNENVEITEIVKKIRDLSLIYGVPIILVGHLKKKDLRLKQIIPELEDFHGTSNIGKTCTKAVILAPKYDTQQINPNLWATYMRVAKYRVDGSKTRFVGLTWFDNKKNAYRENFDIGRITDGGTQWTELTAPAEIPDWAAIPFEDRMTSGKIVGKDDF